MVPGGSDGNSFFCTRIATSLTTTPTTPTASLRRYVWAPKTLFAFTVASAYRILAVLSERTLNFSADFFAKPGIPKQHCHVHYLMGCTLKIINRTFTKKTPQISPELSQVPPPRYLAPDASPEVLLPRIHFTDVFSQIPPPKRFLADASPAAFSQKIPHRFVFSQLLHTTIFPSPNRFRFLEKEGGCIV